MKVSLISLSNPLTTGINNAEELISYCARVSNPDNQLNQETAPKLLHGP
jgi:thymidylate synthase (FAD)